jgi:predicted ATP-dependent serine protease
MGIQPLGDTQQVDNAEMRLPNTDNEETPKSQKSTNKTPSGAMSVDEVMAQEFVVLDLGPYRKYFGSVSNSFDAMFHGQPGAGKTHFLIGFANWLAENVGNTLFISSEELGSLTMQNIIKKSIGEKKSKNLYFSKSMKGLNLNDYVAVFMDSVNHVGLDINSYKELREQYPEQIFILILQKTKGGQFKGGKDWEHEVDIAGEFRFDKITKARILDITTKNRYGTLGEYSLN